MITSRVSVIKQYHTLDFMSLRLEENINYINYINILII